MDWKIEQKINEVFKLQAFRTGVHSIKATDKQPASELRVRFLWAATLTYFEKVVHVCIVHTNEGPQGLLLIPPMYKPFDRDFGGPIPLKPVSLRGWQDPVELALASLDLTPGGGHTYGDGAYSFDLIATTDVLYFKLWSSGPTLKEGLDRLGKGIIDTVITVGKAYNHREIKEVFKGAP